MIVEHLSFLPQEYVSLSSRPAYRRYSYLLSLSRRRLQFIRHVCRSNSHQHAIGRKDQTVGIVRSTEQLRHQQLETDFHSSTLLYNKSSLIFKYYEDSPLIWLSAINFCLNIATSRPTSTASILPKSSRTGSSKSQSVL